MLLSVAAETLTVAGGQAVGGTDQPAERVAAVTAPEDDDATAGHGQRRQVADAIGAAEGVAPGAADAIPLAARQQSADATGLFKGATKVRASR